MKKQIIHVLGLTVVALLVAVVISRWPSSPERISSVYSDLIAMSGILAGIGIAYIVSKVFQLREERSRRLSKIQVLANKITAFRKLLHRVMNNRDFWLRYTDVQTFKSKYGNVSYHDLHDHESMDSELFNFYDDNDIESRGTIDLYLAMKEIVDEANGPHAWPYDAGYEPVYSLDEVVKYYDPANQIWYYLDGRYGKYMQGRIKEDGFTRYEDNIIRFATEVDEKYRNQSPNYRMVASLGADFHAVYLPKIARLIRLNEQGMPMQVYAISVLLSIIMCFGVLVPLVMQSLDNGLPIHQYILLSCVSVVAASVVGLLLYTFQAIRADIIVRKAT